MVLLWWRMVNSKSRFSHKLIARTIKPCFGHQKSYPQEDGNKPYVRPCRYGQKMRAKRMFCIDTQYKHRYRHRRRYGYDICYTCVCIHIYIYTHVFMLPQTCWWNPGKSPICYCFTLFNQPLMSDCQRLIPNLLVFGWRNPGVQTRPPARHCLGRQVWRGGQRCTWRMKQDQKLRDWDGPRNII